MQPIGGHFDQESAELSIFYQGYYFAICCDEMLVLEALESDYVVVAHDACDLVCLWIEYYTIR